MKAPPGQACKKWHCGAVYRAWLWLDSEHDQKALQES